MTVRGEVLIPDGQAERADSPASPLPGKPGSPTAEKHEPGGLGPGIGTGSSTLLEPPRSRLLPNLQAARDEPPPASSTKHVRAITNITGDGAVALVTLEANESDGISGHGPAQDRGQSVSGSPGEPADAAPHEDNGAGTPLPPENRTETAGNEPPDYFPPGYRARMAAVNASEAAENIRFREEDVDQDERTASIRAFFLQRRALRNEADRYLREELALPLSVEPEENEKQTVTEEIEREERQVVSAFTADEIEAIEHVRGLLDRPRGTNGEDDEGGLIQIGKKISGVEREIMWQAVVTFPTGVVTGRSPSLSDRRGSVTGILQLARLAQSYLDPLREDEDVAYRPGTEEALRAIEALPQRLHRHGAEATDDQDRPADEQAAELSATPTRHERAIIQIGDADHASVVINEAAGSNGSAGNGPAKDRPGQTVGTPGDPVGTPPREPGMAGKEPPPPHDSRAEASGDDREAVIQELLRRGTEAWERWQRRHEGEQTLALRDATAEEEDQPLRGLLSPLLQRIYDINEALDPRTVRVRIDPDSNRDRLRFLVVEERPEQVTNKESFGNATGQSTRPDDVDPTLWEERARLEDLVANDTIKENDKPLFFAMVSTIGPSDELDLYINYVTVREELRRNNLASNFYDGLRQVAHAQNFPLILGESNPSSSDETEISTQAIFLSMGRQRYADLPPQLRERIDRKDPQRLISLEWVTVDNLSGIDSPPAEPPRDGNSAETPREGQTIVERHQDEWPEIHMKTNYFAHGTLPDLTYLRNALKRSRAALFFYEDSEVSEVTRQILQRAADVHSAISPDEFIRSMSQEYGEEIFGSFREMYIRTVFGTRVVVAPLDIQQSGEDPYGRGTTVADINDTLQNLWAKYKDIADRTNNRDATTVSTQLEIELERIFDVYSEFLEQRDEPLTAFIARAFNHEGTFDDRLRSQGFNTENITQQRPHYLASDRIIKKLLADPEYEPTRQELLEAHMETLMKNVLGSPLVRDLKFSDPEIYYYNIVTEQFKDDEETIQELHDLYLNGRLGPRRLNRIIRNKGLGNIPTNVRELYQVIADYEFRNPQDPSPVLEAPTEDEPPKSLQQRLTEQQVARDLERLGEVTLLARDGDPLPLQVSVQLAEKIESEELIPGRKMPGTKALAQAFGVSVKTVQEANKLLAEGGYITIGRRFNVAGPISPEVEELLQLTPRAAEIYEVMETRITDGIYSERQKLPTSIELAEELQAYRETINEAMGLLARRNYISDRGAHGRYVNPFEGELGVIAAPLITPERLAAMEYIRNLPVGEMPSQTEMADRSGLSQMELRLATRDLERLGEIERRGSGLSPIHKGVERIPEASQQRESAIIVERTSMQSEVLKRSMMQLAEAELNAWIVEHPGPRLDGLFGTVIPPEILDTIDDPTRLNVKMGEQSEDRVEFMITEWHPYKVTDKETLLNARRRPGAEMPQEQQDNPLPWRRTHLLEQDVIGENDEGHIYVSMHREIDAQSGEAILVLDTLDIPKQTRKIGQMPGRESETGVVASFTQKVIDLAGKLGFRYVAGWSIPEGMHVADLPESLREKVLASYTGKQHEDLNVFKILTPSTEEQIFPAEVSVEEERTVTQRQSTEREPAILQEPSEPQTGIPYYQKIATVPDVITAERPDVSIELIIADDNKIMNTQNVPFTLQEGSLFIFNALMRSPEPLLIEDIVNLGFQTTADDPTRRLRETMRALLKRLNSFSPDIEIIQRIDTLDGRVQFALNPTVRIVDKRQEFEAQRRARLAEFAARRATLEQRSAAAREPTARERRDAVISSFDTIVEANRDLASEQLGLGHSVDRSVAESTGFPLDVVRDILVIDRVSQALNIDLHPKNLSTIRDINYYRAVVFDRINRAISSAGLSRRERLLFGMHLGLPPTLRAYESFGVISKSGDKIIPYEQYYQWTQREDSRRDIETITNSFFSKSNAEQVQAIFNNAAAKVNAEMTAQESD